MSDLQCSILCSPDVEENLLDRLLVTFPESVFTSTPTFGHGIAHGTMSANERVMGRARILLVQIILPSPQWETLRGILARDFGCSGIRFWVAPISDAGVLA